MGKPSAAELNALAEAGPLMRFAAEHVKDKELPPELSLAIAEAQAAADNDQWTPKISQEFWSGFSKLCDLIQPVTMDCLTAANQNIQPRRWLPFGRSIDKISIAERFSGRYLIALISLLALVILPLQLYVWTCTNLSKKIDDLFSANYALLSQRSEEFRKLNSDPNYVGTLDEQKAQEKIKLDAASMNADVDRMLYEAGVLEKISTLNHLLQRFFPAARVIPDVVIDEAINAPWQEAYPNATARLNQARIPILKAQEKANLIVGIFASFILPILFGTIGAIAYVIRTISNQIKSTTFSQSSPIRHKMRVALGALAGVVIGLFNSLSTQLSLSPLALAFLAGYGVEAVFSMFDVLVDKFKQTPSASQTTAEGKTTG